MRKTTTIIICSVMFLYTVMLYAMADMTGIAETYESIARELSHQVPDTYYCFDVSILINHTL